MPEYQDIELEELADGVSLLRLNRPATLNAMRFETYDELAEAIGNHDTRALVITGAGRGFCSGDDVRAVFNGGEGVLDIGDDRGLLPAARAILMSPFPVIAAVNGPAVGWGMELALLADIRIAAASARFAEFFVLRGQCADVAGLARLTQLVGRERAARLLYSGQIIDADEALAIGLVGEVVPDDGLLDAATELATMIASQPPLAIRAIKEGLRRGTDPDWEALGQWAGPTHAALFRTEDHREAVKAFLERRTPTYVGR